MSTITRMRPRSEEVRSLMRRRAEPRPAGDSSTAAIDRAAWMRLSRLALRSLNVLHRLRLLCETQRASIGN